MKVLKFEEFAKTVDEKLNPEEQVSLKNGEKLASLSSVAKRLEMLGHRIGDLAVPAGETVERFKEWDSLDFSEQEKKHKQRTEKKMTQDKIVATLWAALKMYGGEEKYKGVVNGYADRVKNVLDLTEDELNAVYFEK